LHAQGKPLKCRGGTFGGKKKEVLIAEVEGGGGRETLFRGTVQNQKGGVNKIWRGRLERKRKKWGIIFGDVPDKKSTLEGLTRNTIFQKIDELKKGRD